MEFAHKMKKLTKTLLRSLLTLICVGISVSAVGNAVAPLKKLTPRQAAATELRAKKNALTMGPQFMKVNERPISSRPRVVSYPGMSGERQKVSQVMSADGSKIFGCMIYNSTWTTDNQPAGMYSFTLGDGETLAEVAVGDDYIANGGGVFMNDKFCYVSYISYMGYVVADYNILDFNTWQIEESIPVDVGSIARDMTYDPVTGNIYGCFLNDDGDGWVFGRMNPETGSRTLIRDLDVVYVVVAANSKGEVYAIDLYGNLLKMDKQTGVATKIGNTGHSPQYSASGCFDLRTDKFYWECLESDEVARIFEVNVEDATVVLNTTLPDTSELISMFIPVPAANDGAPGEVSDFSVDFDQDSLSGTISFTMPSKQFAGADLTGELGYDVTVNEVSYKSGKAAAGSAISLPVSVEKTGEYRFAVYTSNSEGNSPTTILTKWVGYDSPKAVRNLKLAKGATEGEVVLTWDAVTETVHGGYIDPAAIRYEIIRLPDGKVLSSAYAGTSITDQLETSGELVTYSYEVTAINGTMISDATESNTLTVGLASLPFYEPFDQNELRLFYVVDANNDGYTWTYDGTWESARLRYSSANNWTMAQDDWMFTPKMHLNSGRLYLYSMTSRCYMSSEPERVEVKLGTDQSPESMTQEVLPVTPIENEVKEVYSKYITVAEDGDYTFGIHGCSLADKMYLYVDDVTVEAGPLLGTPNAVTGLTAEAGADGAYSAKISFTTPKTTVDDNSLKSITEVRVMRDGEVIKTYKNPEVGSKLTYTDNGAHQGNNEYSVIAANSIGDGFEVSTTVFVGYDIPSLATNVKAKEEDGKVVITWEAPTIGANGGYVDPEKLEYIVLRANDSGVIAQYISGKTATDSNPPLNGYQQEFFAYYVFAVSAAGIGDGQMSNIVVVGEPFALPFKESFPNVGVSNDPWDVEAPDDSGASWNLLSEGSSPTASPQDNDGGLVSFVPEDGGDTATLYSGKIDFKNASNPALEYYYYYVPDCFDYMTVYLSADGGDFEKVDLISYRTLEGEEGWRQSTVDLAKYASAKYIQLAFEGKSYDGTYNLHLDNIRVLNKYDYNLSVSNLSLPTKGKVGSTMKVGVTVENIGLVPTSGYTVDLYVNGKVEASQSGEMISEYESKTFNFSVVPTVHYGKEAEIYAVVNWIKDEDLSDNTSEKKLLSVTQPNYPAVEDLSAVVEDLTVSLSWSEPESTNADGNPITDGAESYKAFSIAGVGDWSMVDRDKSGTYYIGTESEHLSYDNAGSAMAFIVFNPSKAGIELSADSDINQAYAPHSGDQYFACFASYDSQNDDWMISPELPGSAQEVSFYVKTVIEDYPEQYEVYYSTDGDDVTDFIKIGGTRTAPAEWTEVKVVFPEGTKYFAIRCVSNDQFIFAVDDIKYLPESAMPVELSLMGFNVYCNGEKLNEAPVEELSYIHTLTTETPSEYYVTVVYDKGESPISNIVSVFTSGVSDITAGRVSVMSEGQSIVIKNAEGEHVNIFSLNGHVLVDSSAMTSAERYAMSASGVYVVVVGKRAYRVIVK